MSSRVFDPHKQRFAPRNRPYKRHFIVPVCSIFLAALAACSPSNPDGEPQNSKSEEESNESTTESEKKEFECQIPDGEDTDFVQVVGCEDDFEALASAPLDVSIPGARSLKTVVDRIGDNEVYFQNSNKYKIHWEFVSEHLSGNGLPIVPTLAEFNTTEYYSPDRRFVLGALTHYEGPNRWVWELSPYDTADAEMITAAFHALAENIHNGDELAFHPTSQALEKVAKELDEDIPVLTTDDIFKDIVYQPLNLGTSVGKLRVMKAEDLETEYVGFEDIVVLDAVPNDISVVRGIVTATFQTPLSHINVLSQNRGTPNMGLREADNNEELTALDGKWVRFRVGANDWSVEEVTKEDADKWWEENKPDPLGVPALDLETTDLRYCTDMLSSDEEIKAQVKELIPAYGGKASHYGALARITSIPSPRAFGIPVYYYWQFMEENGFHDRVKALLEDESFQDSAQVRDEQLEMLRDDMIAAPLNEAFMELLEAKLRADYDGVRMRFRSSTNAEDLEGFTGAGLYTSKSGELDSEKDPVWDAIREVWASVWFFRAFEERSYRSIDHTKVGMSLLVHRSFPDEEANGVALTANPFDPTGAEPGFYINVQEGESSVVQPDPGVTTDQFIYHYSFPGQPVVFIAHSNLVPTGDTVLTNAETTALGKALNEIHEYFKQAYGPPPEDPNRWYAMDVEFKFDEPLEGGEVQLWVKQARPHPGWGK